MKMAKPSGADLSMAMKLTGAIDSLAGHWPVMPEAVERVDDPEKSEPFDLDDPEQCQRALEHVLDLARSASLSRVVWSCAVMVDPANRCVDPESDVIEHHPDALAGLDARKARPAADWAEEYGAVLWWHFPEGEPVSAPWYGRPTDQNWPGQHSHWTPVVVPHVPTAAEAAAAA